MQPAPQGQGRPRREVVGTELPKTHTLYVF